MEDTNELTYRGESNFKDILNVHLARIVSKEIDAINITVSIELG